MPMESCVQHSCLARIAAIDPESPADDAGFTPGCALTAVNGHPLRDIIDWRWYADGPAIEVAYIDADGDEGTVELFREDGENWGFEFEKAVFDGVIQCCNACTFCFMRQLPDDARDSLTLRDDDYRLSFLQGTFVTFTNMSSEDEARIIRQNISPLRYSLHAASPDVRRAIIGKHADHGIETADRLLAAGIELHAQIVLMPGVNDGDELRRTLEWAYARPGILSVGIVPVGYTRHQTACVESFDTPQRARTVLACIAPFQERAMRERRDAWVHASDEFYRNAYPSDLLDHLPASSFYGDFELFEDGIGIVRSFVDDWEASADAQQVCASVLADHDARGLFVCGCAQREFFTPLLEASPLATRLVPLYVENEYFGGNVDVTGLLCGCDMGPALRQAVEQARAARSPYSCAVLPKVIFNADGVTLDDMHLEEIQKTACCPLHVVSCQASGFLPQITDIISAGGFSA